MTFEEVLNETKAMLQRQGRISYRALQLQFELDDHYLEVLKDELIDVHQVAVDRGGKMLVWTGEPSAPSPHTRYETDSETATHETLSTQAESRPRDTPIPDAERRQLTVMFCDLVGSTALSGELDPEDLREVVKAYQSACTAVIRRYDGYVAQLLGDGLLVYFGYPSAHEDDAQRAIHTGLGIIESIGNLNRNPEQMKSVQLSVRLSVHTGPVVVGEMGGGDRHEQLALGETPNLAARLQGLAEPDTVVISEATHRLVQGYFDCETLGARELRGVTEPVVVYQVRQESDARSRLDIARAIGLTPLVGRESETTLLVERWEQAKDGSGQVILLSGEAGIGKSRLVEVLKDHVSAEGSHTRLECRSSPYFTNSALYPIIDFIQRMLQWHQEDLPEERLEKLERELSRYRLPLKESVPLFASLLSLPIPEDCYPPLNLTPQRQRQKTLEGIVAMLLELAERQPILFILEDLHWTDPTTLELLDFLIEQTPTVPIYTLLTCRPEFQSQWGNRSYFIQVTLNRLSRDDIEQMVVTITDGKPLPEEIVQQLVDKTDGVPLYVEEMTKTVLESGVLKETDGRYELTDSISTLSIPTTLQDSLMARLDRLVTAKGVAQQAAVIGRQFSYTLLQAISELDDTVLERELGLLIDAELIYQRGLSPRATYIFKHALIQDTAAQSLLRSTRQQYHRRIAEVLEERFPETAENQPELLAHHYTEVGLTEQAVGYWQQAGEKAIERSANAEAIAHLNKGLDLLKALPDTSDCALQELTLQRTLGVPLLATKGFAAPEVETVYTRARELCQHIGNTLQLFPVLFGLRGVYEVRGDVQAARELADQLLAIAQHHQDPALLTIGHRTLGDTLYWLGEFISALDHLKQGITLDDSQKHRSHAFHFGEDPGVVCRSYAALVLWILGYPEQAVNHERDALLLAQNTSHPFSVAFALNMILYVDSFRGNWQTAQKRAETLIALSIEQGFTQWLASATRHQGWVWVRQGQIEEGIAQIRQGIASLQATGAELGQLWSLALLAEAYEKKNQIEKALSFLEEALALLDHTKQRFCEAELHRLKGELLLQQSPDNYTDAEFCFHQSIEIAQHQSAKSWELRSATSLAKLWQQQGKRQDAYDLLAPVYSWFTEGFDTADLQDAKSFLDALGG